MINPPFSRLHFRNPFMSYYALQKPPVEKINNLAKPSLNAGFEHDKKNQENKGFFDYNSQIFNIMGITLYLDDILIIFMLFFLYSEDVKDDLLFTILLMLLLS